MELNWIEYFIYKCTQLPPFMQVRGLLQRHVKDAFWNTWINTCNWILFNIKKQLKNVHVKLSLWMSSRSSQNEIIDVVRHSHTHGTKLSWYHNIVRSVFWDLLARLFGLFSTCFELTSDTNAKVDFGTLQSSFLSSALFLPLQSFLYTFRFKTAQLGERVGSYANLSFRNEKCFPNIHNFVTDLA